MKKDSFVKKVAKKVTKILSDKLYLKLLFRFKVKRKLNLKNPQTFNEKLQWLKLYDRKPEYIVMVDKYAVKEYVSNLIGKEYVIPTIGVFDKFDDIDFNALPNRFVIKCTHDSGGLVICKDKNTLNVKEARKIINKSLKNNYFYFGREWPYKNVKPRIIVEEYMEDESGYELKDYKFFCFNGKVKLFKIDFNRAVNHRANYYDVNCNLLHFGEEICPPEFNKNLQFPKTLKKMIESAEVFSKGIKFLRVDFYEVKGQMYFGELTFYPSSGTGRFIPQEWDYKLGEMLELDK